MHNVRKCIPVPRVVTAVLRFHVRLIGFVLPRRSSKQGVADCHLQELRPRRNQTYPQHYSQPTGSRTTPVRVSNRVAVFQPIQATFEGIGFGEHHKSAVLGASAVPNAPTNKGGQKTHDSRRAKCDCTCTAPRNTQMSCPKRSNHGLPLASIPAPTTRSKLAMLRRIRALQ